MKTELDRAEQAEVAALVDTWRAAPPQLAEREGLALLEAGAVTALAAASLRESSVHNHAYGVASGADVELIERFYAGRGCPYVVSPAPGSELDSVLEGRGYTRGHAWMTFVRDLAPLSAESALRVAEAGKEAAASFGEVVAAGFGLPPWTAGWIARLPGRPGWVCFLSYDGPQPAGAGALFVDRETGWLGLGATLPAYRGRGSQAALLAARVEAARARGCTLLTTETGVRVDGRAGGSYRNILRAGFVEAGARDNWLPARA